MLYDFIANCKCAIDEEYVDYRDLLNDLKGMRHCVIGLMPAIRDDLYPVFALSCTSARQIVSPNVYVIPVGAHDYWAQSYFEEIVNQFYRDDEIREQFDIELEEMLLLVNPKLKRYFKLEDGTCYNTLVCRITLPDETEKYLVVVPLTPDDCWTNIIEPYDIKCDVIIDSGKGMGHWFDDVPLYKIMRETEAIELLPRYYFKGMYMGGYQVPFGFRLSYTILDKIVYQGHYAVSHGEKEIYEIDWNENKNNT